MADVPGCLQNIISLSCILSDADRYQILRLTRTQHSLFLYVRIKQYYYLLRGRYYCASVNDMVDIHRCQRNVREINWRKIHGAFSWISYGFCPWSYACASLQVAKYVAETS